VKRDRHVRRCRGSSAVSVVISPPSFFLGNGCGTGQ
jgi:hypothetical protein